MKVMQVLPELNSGGVERGTLEVAGFLVKHGHEAVVVSNGGRLVEALEHSGARHIAMPVHRKSLGSLFHARPFRRLLEKEKPDILHFRSRVPGWISWLAWRKMDPETRPRLVSTVHGFYSVNRYSAVMTKGERVIAVSECIRQYIQENYPAVPESRITVIHRGIEPGAYPAGYRPDAAWLSEWESRHPELEGKTLFLLPGRITRLKGHGDFFKLIAALEGVHGLVAGDTHPKKKAYLGELREKLAELGMQDRVTFLGHRSDVREVMAVSDVVCALSQQPESFGRTVLEAMALGKPVLGYDCGGVGELLTHVFPEGKVPLGDTGRLIATAKAILASKPKPLLAEGMYTLEAMCRDTLDLYADLLKSTR
ncbi:glycosyltransferase family 4 protein [Akkermansiaceae bacterium]|nr:glycosyltransferase family 4 protein [Akkermansiaceae bacterium]